MTRLTERLRHLDNRVVGRPVPDTRPLGVRVFRPRPAVWSSRGRFVYGVLLAGMFADLWWGFESVSGIVVFVALFAGLFLVVAADMRKRSRAYHDQRDL